MDALFSIPELLQSILLHLDMKTLLVSCSRVSRQWHQVIQSSPVIQEALYFRPVHQIRQNQQNCIPHLAQLQARRDEDQRDLPRPMIWPEINPLLLEKFGNCFFDTGEDFGFLRRADAFHTLPWKPKGSQKSWRLCGGVEHVTKLEKQDCDRFTRKGASWRCMLVSQPPPPGLGILWMELSDPDDDFWRIIHKSMIKPEANDPVLRMGRLYDFAQYYTSHHNINSSWYRFSWYQPRYPYTSFFNLSVCASLLLQTTVVFEIYRWDDSGFANHPRAPKSLEEFETLFKSEDRGCVKSDMEACRSEQFEDGGFDCAYCVW